MRRGAASLRLVLASTQFVSRCSHPKSARVALARWAALLSTVWCPWLPTMHTEQNRGLMMMRLAKSLVSFQPPEAPCSKSVKRSVWAECGNCAVPTVVPVKNRALWPKFAVRSFRHSTVNSRRRVAQVTRFIPVFDADDTLVLIGSQTNWVRELFAAFVGAPATFAGAGECGRSFWILASRSNSMA